MVVYREKGRYLFGYPIGMLTFGEEEDVCVGIPGTVGNATSYDYPILYKSVEGLSFPALCRKDPEVLPTMIKAGQWLVKQGVRAIFGNCGFFALYQKELAEALSVPVFSSALTMVPILAGSIRKNEKIGIVTANSNSLDEDFLTAVGITKDIPYVLKGLQDKEYITSSFMGRLDLDRDLMVKDTLEVVQEMLDAHPEVRIILLECTVLPPYAYEIQQHFGLPVFDINSLVHFVGAGVVRKPFHGYM